MLQTVFRSADLPITERVTSFDQVTGSHPVRPYDQDPEGFRATVRAADLAAVNVTDAAMAPAECHVRRVMPSGAPDLYAVLFLLRGSFDIAQDGRRAALAAGDFALFDGSRPLEMLTGDGRDAPAPLRLMRVQVPRALVPLPAPGLRQMAGMRLSGQEGMGSLLAQFLTSLATSDAATPRPDDAARLGTVVTDLLTAVLAHHLDAPGRVPDDSRRDALLRGVQSYIQRNLGDPRLSPRTIAAAHHISVSYLHRLFAGGDATVAAWVRRQRLERARRDLADPSLAHLPVHRIASRWGYADHATFTRAFRAAFSLPPQAYREHALGQLA